MQTGNQLQTISTESPNRDSQQRPLKRPRQSVKRRLIIWSHGQKTFGGHAFCGERTDEIIRNLGRQHNNEWKPRVCFLGNDTCSTKVWKRIETLENGPSPGPTSFPPGDKEDYTLSRHKLEQKAAAEIPKLSENIWTVMAMRKSARSAFVNFVQELTDTTTHFQLKEPPFVALLEKKKAGKPWSEDTLLEPGEWRLVHLEENVVASTSQKRKLEENVAPSTPRKGKLGENVEPSTPRKGKLEENVALSTPKKGKLEENVAPSTPKKGKRSR